MYVAEILLTKETYTADDWRKLVLVVSKHVGGLSPLSIIVGFKDNHVRFFIESKKDISDLSSGLEGYILRSVDLGDRLEMPKNVKKRRFLRVPIGGTILDLKERYKLQESKQLDLVRIKVSRVGERLASTIFTLMRVGSITYVTKQRLSLFPAHLFAINTTEAQNYIFASTPNYVSLEKTLHLLQTEELNAIFSVPGFPYSTNDYYLPLSSYQYDAHSLIVGASGSGKSRLIQLLVNSIERFGTSREQYRIVVIDPHASLETDLQHVAGSRIINLGNESAQLFPDASADISAATELTTTLFKSLLNDQYNPRLERVLRFSVYVLLTAQIMTLDNLKNYLTDLDMRLQVLEHVQGFVPQNIQQFFGTDFNELRTQYYNESILPIVSLVDEMQLQPSLVGESTKSLVKTVQENYLTVFSLNKVSMGEKAVKTVAGLLIQQIFLIAQARVLPYKLILIVDEVSVVQNPALASILAEARKFNLSVILTQQYFSQVNQEVRDAILSNVVNYYIFRVSEEDAKQLEGNIVIDLPDEIVEKGIAKGQKESDIKIGMFTALSSRECFVRIMANGQLMPAIRARTLDIGSGFASQQAAPSANSDQVLHKLPPKLILENSKQFSESQAAVIRMSTEPQAEISLPEIAVNTVRLEDLIDIKQVLADQSSSRKDSRKVV